jgi:hypothetical protein
VAMKPKRGSLTRDEMKAIIIEAHEACKKEIGVTIGKKRLTRSRAKYLDCLKREIKNRIAKKLADKGIKVSEILS